MKYSDLKPIFEAAYQKDQSDFISLKNKETQLKKVHQNILNSHAAKPESSRTIEAALLANNHHKWKELQAREITRQVFEMQPKIETAKRNLKRSFGRLEALRAAMGVKDR